MSLPGNGVHGESTSGSGVFGTSQTGTGIGVSGTSGSGAGVTGTSDSGAGVTGTSDSGAGVTATSNSGAAITATSNSGSGIEVNVTAGEGYAVIARVTGTGVGVAVYGEYKGINGVGEGYGGYFIGHVFVSHDLYVRGDVVVDGDVVLPNQDCAEDFEILGNKDVEEGSVLVIASSGALKLSDEPYDKRVAGVVSGAGEFKSGIILGRRPQWKNRKPVALVGRVYCKVDARYSPIEIGDLLTTSATPGHAMKAENLRAFGAVIGKAMEGLESGQGLIPILVALQ
jgi:hypothetical protein